jgi:nucleotidyltransferase substrate binding protein (TIGR01987 family)
LSLAEENDIKQDAVIKRFEFTYELLWKTFKKIARLQKLDCFGPKDCFKIAFKLGLIEDEQLFLEIIDARNKTTHVYSKEDARKIYCFVKERVVSAFDKVAKSIEKSSFL